MLSIMPFSNWSLPVVVVFALLPSTLAAARSSPMCSFSCEPPYSFIQHGYYVDMYYANGLIVCDYSYILADSSEYDRACHYAYNTSTVSGVVTSNTSIP